MPTPKPRMASSIRPGTRPSRVLALTALAFLLAACGDDSGPTEPDASPTEVTVSGTVLASGSERGVGDATVIGVGADSDTELFRTTTDEDGAYEIQFTMEGPTQGLILRGEAEGYASAQRMVAFNQLLTVDLDLDPIPESVEVLNMPPSPEVGTTEEIHFEVSNFRGDPVPGARVSLEAAEGSGSVDLDEVETDGNGRATAQWTLGTKAGAQDLHASVDAAAFTLTVEAVAGAPAALESLAGDGQVRRVGTELAEPLQVVLQDQFGNPVVGEEIVFQVLTGAGTISGSSGPEVAVSTDEGGVARSWWTLGGQSGSQEVEARHDGLEAILFHAQALDFHLTLSGAQESERFLAPESVALSLEITGDPVPLDSIRWYSDVDGELGSGPSVTLEGLTSETHQIEAHLLGGEAEVSIRVFDDLWDLYRSEPAPSEIERIKNDFNIVYVDGDEPDEQWDLYGYDFNPHVNEPSRLVIISRLDVLRRQRFEERPTFIGDHETVYDWVRSVANEIRVDLGNCAGAWGGGGRMTLSRAAAHYGVWASNLCDTTDSVDFVDYRLGIIIHEARHSEPGDPGHMTCERGIAGDQALENGSGYAWAAKYAMWAYKYGKYDPPFLREGGGGGVFSFRQQALTQLRRICEDLSHSDPRVQAIVDELKDDL